MKIQSVDHRCSSAKRRDYLIGADLVARPWVKRVRIKDGFVALTRTSGEGETLRACSHDGKFYDVTLDAGDLLVNYRNGTIERRTSGRCDDFEPLESGNE